MTKEFIKALPAYVALSIAADGVIAQEELDLCKDLCEDLSIEWDILYKEFTREAEVIGKIKGPELKKYLTDLTVNVERSEYLTLFEACVNLVLADGELTFEECEALEIVTSIMEVPTSILLARIAYAIDTDKIKINVKENLMSL